MFTYFKMKKKEWQVKAMLYDFILNYKTKLSEMKKEILKSLNILEKAQNLTGNVNSEELTKEFVSKLAEVIHSENKSDNVEE